MHRIYTVIGSNKIMWYITCPTNRFQSILRGENYMKLTKYLLTFFIIILVGCTTDETEKLTRIDIQNFDIEGTTVNQHMVTDEDELNDITDVLNEVKWSPNTEAEMARKEDVKVTFFYTFNKNMPERLFVYRVWFNDDASVTLISNKETEGYGTLEPPGAQYLKDVLREPKK